jgi:glycosyltransferase 2 family protein
VGEYELAAGGDPLAAPGSVTDAPAAGHDHKWRRRIVIAVRVIAVVVIAYFVVYTTVRQWAEVRGAFTRLSAGTVAASTLAALLAIGATMLSWRATLADLGHRLPVRAAAQINLVGQLAKYLPGSVWAYVLQAELGRRFGVPRSRSLLASLVATMLGVTAGVTIGTLGLRTMLNRPSSAPYAGTGRLVVYVALAVLPIALVCAHPRVLTRLAGFMLRLTRRDPLVRPLSWAGVLRTLGWSAVGYLLCGVHLWLLARSAAAPGLSGFVVCVGAFALAMIAGVFVVVAPASIGVREFVIGVTLAGLGVSFGAAYALALVSRLLFTVADVVAAGGAALVATRRVHQPPVAAVTGTSQP